MSKQVHILNGDALKAQFPDPISGDIIIVRECLVDGDVTGNTIKEFYSTRAKFLKSCLQENSTDFYYQKTVVEFEKIRELTEKSEINLWFEDDLFCQVNLWFVFHLLNKSGKSYSVNLVRPNEKNRYNFGGMSQSELIEAFQNKTKIEEYEYIEFAKFWNLYQEKNIDKMLKIATKLNDKYSFILPAVIAFSELIPQNGRLSKPEQTLIQIKHELNTTEFEPVFKEFCKREAIYGFGDLQVKRILDKLNIS